MQERLVGKDQCLCSEYYCFENQCEVGFYDLELMVVDE